MGRGAEQCVRARIAPSLIARPRTGPLAIFNLFPFPRVCRGRPSVRAREFTAFQVSRGIIDCSAGAEGAQREVFACLTGLACELPTMRVIAWCLAAKS